MRRKMQHGKSLHVKMGCGEKDAQAAASYMDLKAGLISEKEYEKARGSVMEVKKKERALER